MNNKSSDNRILSLQALRALAFLGIFFSHAGFFVSWPALGVSAFFVMSGFLLEYRHYDDELDTSLRGCADYSWRRIRKQYPLHIITMLFAVALNVFQIVTGGLGLRSWLSLAFKMVLNTFLVQSLFPHGYVAASLNGVAWYLSASLFLYFAFPFITRKLKNLGIIQSALLCLIILAAQVGLCGLALHFVDATSPVYTWFSYIFPAFRLGDFITGIVVGKVFRERKNENSDNRVLWTAFEVLASTFTIAVLLWERGNHESIMSEALANLTTLYIPIAAVWTYLFASGKGLISGILTNKVMIWLGDLSVYLFLIHFNITQYVRVFMEYMGINAETVLTRWALMVAELAISIGLTYIWIRYFKNRFSKHERT